MLNVKHVYDTIVPLALAAYGIRDNTPKLPDGWRLNRTICLRDALQPDILVRVIGCKAEEIGSPFGYIASTDTEQAVVFRGTQCGVEWMEDFNAKMVPLSLMTTSRRVYVEAGFLAVHRALDTPSLQLLDLQKPTTIIGHSLGGAIAQLYAFENLFDSVLVPHTDVYTFGSPRPGSAAFASMFPATHFRSVNLGDIIPHTPPELFGYQHSGIALEVDGMKDMCNFVRSAHGLASYSDGLKRLAGKLSRVAA